MNRFALSCPEAPVSAGCHINDVMNNLNSCFIKTRVSAGCHINDVMNNVITIIGITFVSAGCHINDVMNQRPPCRP